MYFFKKMQAFFSLKRQRGLLSQAREQGLDSDYKNFIVTVEIYRLIINPVLITSFIYLLFFNKKEAINRKRMIRNFFRENTLVIFNGICIPGTFLFLSAKINGLILCLTFIISLCVYLYLIYVKINDLFIAANLLEEIEPFGLNQWVELNCIKYERSVLSKCIKGNQVQPFNIKSKNRL